MTLFACTMNSGDILSDSLEISIELGLFLIVDACDGQITADMASSGLRLMKACCLNEFHEFLTVFICFHCIEFIFRECRFCRSYLGKYGEQRAKSTHVWCFYDSF